MLCPNSAFFMVPATELRLPVDSHTAMRLKKKTGTLDDSDNFTTSREMKEMA